MKNIFNKVPRWMVFQIDLFICLTSILFSYFVIFEFEFPQKAIKTFHYVIPVVVLVKAIFFYITKSYAGIIRYTSVTDAKRIFEALSYSFVVLIVINTVYKYQTEHPYFIPYRILIFDYVISLLSMSAFRLVTKIIYYEWKHFDAEKINVVIYGAGEAGTITKKTLSQDVGKNYNVVAFVDDDNTKQGKTIDGAKILSNEKLEDLITEKSVDELIIAIQNISIERKRKIIDTCLSYGIQVRNVPPVDKWINGELSFKQLKEVRIEDVLGRDEINVDINTISSQISSKVVMVTGAAGSIGSELARQLSTFSPKKLIILDQAESSLYDIELELRERYLKETSLKVILADVTNKERVEEVFQELQPNLIFHAAAYKHVPMMEQNPAEAIAVNVQGSKNIADMALKYGAEKFIMVSTDKAVNPTNVMGASKRIAEIYTQSLNMYVEEQGNQSTKFVTTRFGNVLGSNGSVIPRFRKQIAEGGPVTVTHPEITRYFRTIPEAVKLVLDAGAMGKGGEIFLFDMGKAIKIVDLAKKMIRLSGLTLGKDIQLIFTGLRPGEKLYEELLADQENTLPTHNSKIMVAQVRSYQYKEVAKLIDQLIACIGTCENDEIVRQMKALVPEFISKNSVYEKLDIHKTVS